MSRAENSGRVIRAIAVLAEAFNVKASELLLEAYVAGLSDLPPGDVERAAQAAIIGSKWFPKVFELRQMAGASASLVSIEERASIAWQAVRRAIRVYGAYKSVQFDDPFATATVRALGGWVDLCETPSGEKLDVWKKKEFDSQYALIEAREIDAEEASVLAGCLAVNRYTFGDQVVRIPVGLPEPDKKLIRGVIRIGAPYVAISGPEVESLVTSLGIPELDEKPVAQVRESISREQAAAELIRAAKQRGWSIERADEAVDGR